MKRIFMVAILMASLGAVFAFMPKHQDVKATIVTFQYMLDQETGIDDPANWIDRTSGGVESCSSGTDLPCVVSFSTDDFAPQNGDNGITSFLQSYSDASSIVNSPYLVDSKAAAAK